MLYLNINVEGELPEASVLKALEKEIPFPHQP